MTEPFRTDQVFRSNTAVATSLPDAVSQEQAIRRVQHLLDELEELGDRLNDEDAYEVPTSGIQLPADFCLSIVVPVYNERSTVRNVIARLLALDIPKEIIVVDDGSTDGTRDTLAELEAIPSIHLIAKNQNEGKGSALQTGFAHATGHIVVVQDADMEYDPRDIPRLLEPILNGQADVVYGSRFLENRRQGSSRVHRAGNRLLTFVSNLTTGLRLTDMETCYKVFRREVIRDVTIRQPRFGVEPEFTAKIARRGFRITELPIRYNAREWCEGKKIGLHDAFEALFCILRYAWRD